MHQYNEITRMKRPKDSQVKVLREWIESPHLGGGCGFIGRDLGGFVQDAAYDIKHAGDLVMLAEELGEDDLLTRFISGPVLRLFHAFWRRYKVCSNPKSPPADQMTDPHEQKPVPLDPENQLGSENTSSLYHYSDEHVYRVIDVIGTVVASVTPVISIVVLYVVNSMRIRLGLVCIFTLIFSFVLALATKARRVEIFAATAA
jgi:hypothetical protein